MIVLPVPDAEDGLFVYSFVWTKHRNVTNRQTDGRTAVAITASNADALKKTLFRGLRV